MSFSRGLSLGMIVFVVACSARSGGGGGGSTDPDASTPTDSPAASGACADLCARVITTSGCTNDLSSCMNLCEAGSAFVPAACRAQYDTTLACARTSSIACPTASQITFPGCSNEQMTLGQCVAAASDAGP
jgi:hypothetical protein